MLTKFINHRLQVIFLPMILSTPLLVIKNKPHAAIFYGASVAGPVFKEIADQVYNLKVGKTEQGIMSAFKKSDSSAYSYAGYTTDLQNITNQLNIRLARIDGKGNYSKLSRQGKDTILSSQGILMKRMPQLYGMGLKDAVYLAENLGLKVMIRGKGKVSSQSISAGQSIFKGQTLNILLN